jgi:hypothetical protein
MLSGCLLLGRAFESVVGAWIEVAADDVDKKDPCRISVTVIK